MKNDTKKSILERLFNRNITDEEREHIGSFLTKELGSLLIEDIKQLLKDHDATLLEKVEKIEVTHSDCDDGDCFEAFVAVEQLLEENHE